MLGVCCLQLASGVAEGPHVLCWDNINISLSTFVEQRTEAPAKVQSGTFALLYGLPLADPNKMQLTPILARSRSAPDITFNHHIRPTLLQLESTFFQMKVIVIQILIAYSPEFECYAHCPELQHRSRRLTLLMKTETFPLRVTTINEATVARMIQIWQTIYEEQLMHTHEQMQDLAVPSFNDQLTNACVHGAKVMHSKDINPFLRLDNIQLGYGVFHKCMNLIWALLKMHQGAISQLGSLKYFFALLEKTCLSNDKLDYHTLLAALMQILNGIIIAAWQKECGYPSLKVFAASNPTPVTLLEIAQQIIVKYVNAMEELPKPKKKKMAKLNAKPDGKENRSDGEDVHSGEESNDDIQPETSPLPDVSNVGPAGTSTNSHDDLAHCNIRILVQDLLVVAELIQATEQGDWGRIEDILGQLTMMFRGAGSNNYSTELLHFIHNLTLVWGEDFA